MTVKVDIARLRLRLALAGPEVIRGTFGSKSKSKPVGKYSALHDLGGKSFLFTGKMGSGFTRAQAQKFVKQAKGKVAKSVTKDLDYLVVGDEGSPRYGKDNKIAKVETMNTEGIRRFMQTRTPQVIRAIAIISEQQFLEMVGVIYVKF